jgi:hypothetical protein
MVLLLFCVLLIRLKMIMKPKKYLFTHLKDCEDCCLVTLRAIFGKAILKFTNYVLNLCLLVALLTDYFE